VAAVTGKAGTAMIVSVPPTMPGLINSINTNVHVGVGTRLFDLAYLFGVSTLFPLYEFSPKIELALIKKNFNLALIVVCSV